MNAPRVHAVLAAGLGNPAVLAAWAKEPQRLRACGVDPSTLDLAALGKFGALAVKVRHNGLRRDLAFTFRLLSVAGLEIDVFSAYALARARRGGFAPTTPERVSDLTAFLGGWLDRELREHTLLWDLIRHESSLARLARAPAPLERPALSGVNGRAVPHIRGALELHEMASDPQATIEALRTSRPALAGIALGERRVGYWRPEAGPEIRIVELDAFGYRALSLVDGRRSVADLTAAMVGRRRPSPGFLALLSQLGQIGILGT